MSLHCILCEQKDDIELVSHIKKDHEGLRQYMLYFPMSKVVNSNLFTAIENAVYFRGADTNETGLDRISKEDRRLIVETAMLQKGAPRSEILVESDF